MTIINDEISQGVLCLNWPTIRVRRVQGGFTSVGNFVSIFPIILATMEDTK